MTTTNKLIFCTTCDTINPSTLCPTCNTETRPIESLKLIELINTLTSAIASIEITTLQANPKQLIELARIIEKGEKQLNKELEKRINQMLEIEQELAIITRISDRMGYSKEGATDDTQTTN